MVTEPRLRFVGGLLGALALTGGLLVVLDAFDGELFFLLALVVVLVVTEYTAPDHVRPAWRRRLALPIYLGLAGFGAIAARFVWRLLTTTPS